MKKIFLIIFAIIIAMPIYADDDMLTPDPENTQAGYAGLVPADETQETIALPYMTASPVAPLPQSRAATPRLSVNAGDLDMNWASAMDTGDPEMRPPQIVLPLLSDYPIEHLEVKFHPLKIQF